MLEPYAGKLACTVLRGGGGRKTSNLPGAGKYDVVLENNIFRTANGSDDDKNR